MTTAQIELLKRLIEAERFYWKDRGNDETRAQERHRRVEVGKHVGVDKRTARSLQDAGLIEGWQDNNQWWIWLKA